MPTVAVQPDGSDSYIGSMSMSHFVEINVETKEY